MEMNYIALPHVQTPAYIVFCDFDETYLANDFTISRKKSLESLETYLYEISGKYNLIFGWVSGRTFESIFKKIEFHKIKMVPHFISGSLGTELSFFDHKKNMFVEDEQWITKIKSLHYSIEKITEIILYMENKYNMKLRRQSKDFNSLFYYSFYLRNNSDSSRENIQEIKDYASKKGVKIYISKCNPMAGDPDNSYDVTFAPIMSGKVNIAEYLIKHYNVNKNKTFAFGDSEGDLELLKFVSKGFLLANAPIEVKKKHTISSKKEYAEGIHMELLRQLESSQNNLKVDS
jgi:kanosamine-6-phosphate phosphatase